MEERWIVRSNIAGILHLPANRLTFKKNGDSKDLVRLLKKSVEQLEKDDEIKLHLSYRNLVTVEKKSKEEIRDQEITNKLDDVINIVKSKDSPKDTGVSKKVDKIIEMIESQEGEEVDPVIVREQIPSPMLDLSDLLKTSGLLDELKHHINQAIKSKEQDVLKEVNEEEEMRDDAMKKLLAKSKDPEKSFDKLGVNKEIESSDEFEHLIDF